MGKLNGIFIGVEDMKPGQMMKTTRDYIPSSLKLELTRRLLAGYLATSTILKIWWRMKGLIKWRFIGGLSGKTRKQRLCLKLKRGKAKVYINIDCLTISSNKTVHNLKPNLRSNLRKSFKKYIEIIQKTNFPLTQSWKLNYCST